MMTMHISHQSGSDSGTQRENLVNGSLTPPLETNVSSQALAVADLLRRHKDG